MAEAIVFNIAAALIENLASLLLGEIGLWRGLKKEMKKLKSTVSTIQAVLLDAEKKYYSDSHQVKDWLDKLKQAMYDADDLLDDFSTEVLRQSLMSGNRFVIKVCSCFSSSNQVVYGLKMAYKIKAIRLRLNEIAEERKFHLDVCLKEAELVRERTQTHSSVPEVVVGRDDDKNKILDLLLLASTCEEANVSVISIWGIGGLGKTTLAQLVFNDEKVQREFELKLWVCVSNDFDIKLIVEKILEHFTGEKHKGLEMNTLKDELRQKLNGKRFLLVLDDVWNEDSNRWSSLKDLLKGGASDSMMLVTTRSKRVAEITSTIASVELKGLSRAESWDLFKKMAFKPGSALISPNSEAIGKEILTKCVGVPLAIKTIGRMLYFKSMKEWIAFRDKEISQVDQQETDILPTLKLSYDHLPSHLKHCFAFCSLYPKGYKFDVQRLVGLWIAAGFVKFKDPNECLEDIAIEYFTDLLWQSFFQEIETDRYGNVKFCKMHDLMHDLSTQISGKECVFLDSDVVDFNESTRHLSFGVNFNINALRGVSSHMLKENKIRTILLHGNSSSDIHKVMSKDWIQYQDFFAHLRYLRILDLNGVNNDRLPHVIHKLKCLRYLDLSGNCSIKFLPHFVTELLNLQILKLNNCRRLTKLPSGITKLVNLRQLHLEECDDLSHMPPGLGQISKLQVLSRFVVADGIHNGGGGLDELRDLSNLREELEILNLRMVANPNRQFAAANLKAKAHLQCLILLWGTKFSLFDNDEDEVSMEELQPHMNLKRLIVDGNGILKFPSWLSTLTNLVEVNISNCRAGQRISPFDHLHSVKQMELSSLDDLECIEIGSTFSFHCLEKLSIHFCPKLKGWWIKAPMEVTRMDSYQEDRQLLEFPRLSELEISACPILSWIPSSFPSLKSLRLTAVNAEVVDSILESTISISSSPLIFVNSPLKYLVIQQIDDLEVLSEDLLRHLVFLETLYVIGNPRLRVLSQGIQHLTSIEDVVIYECPALDFSDDGLQWQHLKSLRTLGICFVPTLEYLPRGLKHLTKLRTLSVEGCTNMESLPDWLDNLRELQVLNIKGCPQLSQSCTRIAAEDWPLIAHISNVKIDNPTVKENGCYKPLTESNF